jgi:hypothetical protein
LGHCGKAEDYAVAALSLIRNYYINRQLQFEEMKKRKQSIQKAITEQRRRSSAAVSVSRRSSLSAHQQRKTFNSGRSNTGPGPIGGNSVATNRDNNNGYNRLLLSSKRRTTTNNVSTLVSSFFSGTSSPSSSLTSLCYEIEKHCISKISLLSIFRGDLLSSLTLFQQYHYSQQQISALTSSLLNFFHRPAGAKRRLSAVSSSTSAGGVINKAGAPVSHEDQIILFAVESYLYRLCNDYLSSLQCIQSILLSKQQENIDYHFLLEGKGILYFILSCHYLCDGNYSQAKEFFLLSLSCYSSLKNYSMMTIISVLIGWMMFYEGEMEEKTEEFLLNHNGEGDSSTLQIKDKHQQKRSITVTKKEDETIPKPFQSDLFLLNSTLSIWKRIRSVEKELPVTSSTVIAINHPYQSKKIFDEMKYDPVTCQEKSVISTNYLTGMTGNPYWSVRVQQLLEISLCHYTVPSSATAFSSSSLIWEWMTMKEWKDLFHEYFQGNPLLLHSASINSKKPLKEQDLFLEKLLSLLDNLYPIDNCTAANNKKSRVLFSQNDASSAFSSDESMMLNDLKNEKKELETESIPLPTTLLFPTSLLHVQHFFYLCYSCCNYLRYITSPSLSITSLTISILSKEEEREFIELIIYLWIGLSHLLELQEMTFPTLSLSVELLQTQIFLLFYSLSLSSASSVSSGISFSSSPVWIILQYLYDNYPLSPSGSASFLRCFIPFSAVSSSSFNVSPMNCKDSLRNLCSNLQETYLKLSGSVPDESFSSSASSSTADGQHFVCMISDLLHNFVDNHCVQHEGSGKQMKNSPVLLPKQTVGHCDSACSLILQYQLNEIQKMLKV